MQGRDLDKYNVMIAEQLKALRWRFQVQEPFWFAFEALANKGLLKLENIHPPITWNTTSGEIEGVALVRESLRLVQQCANMNTDLEGSFRAPVLWPAVFDPSLLYRHSYDSRFSYHNADLREP